MTGTVMITEAAISPPQSTEAYAMKLEIATGSVRVFWLERTRANRKLFQLKMNARMLAVAMPGRRQRQDDPDERCDPGQAVDLGGLLQLHGNALEEARP